jgi:hypothetical protein
VYVSFRELRKLDRSPNWSVLSPQALVLSLLLMCIRMSLKVGDLESLGFLPCRSLEIHALGNLLKEPAALLRKETVSHLRGCNEGQRVPGTRLKVF